MKILILLVMSALVGFAPVAIHQSADVGKSAVSKPEASAEKKEEDCGCDAEKPDDAIAVVNGIKVTRKEVDDPIKDRIKQFDDQIVEARKRELDLQINTRLLDAEAKKRGITTTKLIEQEVISKVKDPDEAEAQAFYDQNKARIQGSFAEIKGEIIKYLLDRRQGEEASRLAARLRAAAQLKVLDTNVTAPANEAERKRVFANLNGRDITSADIEDSLRPLIFDAQEQIYALRKNQLELKINDILIEQEAQKRKLTTASVLEQEVTAKLKPVTEEDALKFYEQNKARITGEYAQVKSQIIEYLQQVERRDKEMQYAGQLRKAATVEIHLREPEPPVYKIATDGQPVIGNPSAPVTIVEFTDFECPSCAKTQPILEEIAKEYGERVRLVMRDFPLNQHPNAIKAAEAAEAAREQGKYWEYIALLFKNQSALNVEKLREYASQVGLDRKKFDEDLDSGKYADRVQLDLIEGNRLGVNSTPTVFINGRRIKEKTRESLKAAIEAALKTAQKD
jgi:protein-disulfide isomerase